RIMNLPDISGIKTIELLKAAQNISERYRSGKFYIANETEALAYALTRMPATYGAVHNALEYALEFYDGTVKTLLDVGAGTGAATMAADSLLELDEITCIEREELMFNLGKKLFENANWVKQDLNTATLPKADLVIASYVLVENNANLVDKLWNAANEILLIVEPGTPNCCAQLKELRRNLIQKGADILAPCPHVEDCENDWCHFTCRIARSKIHKLLKGGDAPYEDEKFSYLALSKNNNRRTNARILRHPIIDTGYVKLNVCTKNGIEDITVTKKNGELYKQARKAKCGDSFNFSV
ncbi:MAG: small ribosomal subunit Rsm22 family protein, partial [Oscillospiraceae bacterium]|nr:small ribosomal subunit Rsm22 family protein [Oscillospiraceae bacterium]